MVHTFRVAVMSPMIRYMSFKRMNQEGRFVGMATCCTVYPFFPWVLGTSCSEFPDVPLGALAAKARLREDRGGGGHKAGRGKAVSTAGATQMADLHIGLFLQVPAGNEGMPLTNHALWFPLREPLASFPHSLLSTNHGK